MPRPDLDVHPEALEEAQAAFLWYSARSEAVGDGFMAELDRAFGQVLDHSQTWPRCIHSTQRYILHRYPFYVVYRLTEQEVQVIAVAHAKRRPGYWKSR